MYVRCTCMHVIHTAMTVHAAMGCTVLHSEKKNKQIIDSTYI